MARLPPERGGAMRRASLYPPPAVNLLESIVLGIVQGLTEFLPISSSAHLRIVPAFLGWDDPGAGFTAVVQLGTMLAEVIYFRRDLWRIGTRWGASLRRPELRSQLDARMGWYLIWATIPIGVLGLLFEDSIKTTFRALGLISCTLIGLGIILLIADRRGTRHRPITDLQLRDGLIMGAAQTLALVPGVSRSGATLTAGLFLGLERAAAARFSFLLSIPAVVLSGLYQAYELITGKTPGDAGAGEIVVATILAFVTGYAAIAFLLRYLVTHSLVVFVAYRIGLGLLVLGLVAAGAIS
jgi:undecaprenyl-diphosphatase